MSSTAQPLLVFLAGAHGVGKTMLCRTTFEPAGFHCVSASSVIKAQSGEVRADKTIGSIDDNQRKLITGIESLRYSHPRLVVDGHFALLNQQRQVERVPVRVFHAMRPDWLVLLHDDPTKIALRLSARDGRQWEPGLIDALQREERSNAESVASDLKVRLEVLSLDEAFSVLEPLLSTILPQ